MKEVRWIMGGVQMTRRTIGLLWLSLLLPGCASTPVPDAETPERNFNALTLVVDASSQARQVLEAIPLESLLERFAAHDAQGRLISYASFTDTDYGGLVFIDGKLHGSISKHDARAYYACRGYTVVASAQYWSTDAQAWLATLLPRVHPETAVKLEFSGKSTVQSIKEASKNPLLSKLRAFIGMGSNPLKVFDTLNTAHNDYEAGERYDLESSALRLIEPGMDEQHLAGIANPTDLAFTGGGMVMGYPEHRVEYFVLDGIIRVVQQPSFHMLFRTRAAQFYAVGAHWRDCTPQKWMQVFPVGKKPAAGLGGAVSSTRNNEPATAEPLPQKVDGEARPVAPQQ